MTYLPTRKLAAFKLFLVSSNQTLRYQIYSNEGDELSNGLYHQRVSNPAVLYMFTLPSQVRPSDYQSDLDMTNETPTPIVPCRC